MSWDEASTIDWMAGVRILDEETLAGLLEKTLRWGTEPRSLWHSCPTSMPPILYPTPRFEPGAHWSARLVLLHVIAENWQPRGTGSMLRLRSGEADPALAREPPSGVVRVTSCTDRLTRNTSSAGERPKGTGARRGSGYF